jgi:hypothetical protein
LSRVKDLFLDKKTVLGLVLTGVGGFLGVWVITSILTIFNYFLNNLITNAGVQGIDYGYLGTTFSILFILGAVASIFLANRFGQLKVMAVGGVLSVFGLLYCGWVVADDPARIILGIVFFAAGTSSVLAMMLSVLVEKLRPVGLTGLAAALIIIADRLAAPGGATFFLSLINPSGLPMVYSAAGLLDLAGLTIAMVILFVASRVNRSEPMTGKPHFLLGRSGVLLLLGVLVFLTAASSALSSNLQVAFFTRSGMTWETLNVIFSTPVSIVFLVLVVLGAGLLSDLASYLGSRQGKAMGARILVLLLTAFSAAAVLFVLANTADLDGLLSGLSSFTPLEAAAITALLALLFTYIQKKRINLIAGIYVALPPLAVAFFNLLTSLVVPINDYESPLVFSEIYYGIGLVCILALVVRVIRQKPVVVERKVDEPTGPR